MTCESCTGCSGCGTGIGTVGPLPGDPDNNSILSATPAFGGIEVSWTYPTTNPNAVAHTLLYRGITNVFENAINISVVAGNRFYDRLDTGTTYYYWIQIVSVSGTVGATIGPASATARPLIEDLIEQLSQQIDTSYLAESLRTTLDSIALNYTELTGLIDERIAAEEALSVAQSQLSDGLTQAMGYIGQELTTRADGDAALAQSIDTIAALNATNAAAISTEQQARVDGDSALALDVDALYTASQENAAAVVDINTAKIGYSALADGSSRPYDGDNATIVYPVATYPAVDYPAYAVNRKRIIDKVGVDNWNATPAGAAKPLVWLAGLPLASAVQGVEVMGPDGEYASLQSAMVAQEDLNGLFKAQYTIKLDVNGRVAGYGLYNDATSSEMIFDVDRFSIGDGTLGNVRPFIVTGGEVFIDEAVINQLTFNKLRDEAGSFIVQDGKVQAQYIQADMLDISWSNVSGTGKPADNATRNTTTSGLFSARPAGNNGDFYYATDTLILYQKIAGAWIVAASVGAPSGTLVNGVSVATLTTATTNFNARNDRTATAVVTPTIASTGTAIDHTLQTNGSADISFEWSFSGSETLVDGFRIYVYQSSSSAAYSFGTTPAAETVYEIPASKRAFILFGVVPDQYYTFGVQAYRVVDPDIDSSGVLTSTIVKSSRSEENPYQPSSTVAFTGDITGTINGVSAATVSTATKNVIYRQSTAPTSGMSTNDVWFNTSTNATYYYSGSAWVLAGEPTNITNVASAVSGGATSGGRISITPNLITVYDASNVVRVKLGNLA